MTHDTRAFLVSLGVHVMAVLLVLSVARLSGYPTKTMLVDFTLLGSGEAGSPDHGRRSGDAAMVPPGRHSAAFKQPREKAVVAGTLMAPEAQMPTQVSSDELLPATQVAAASGARWMSESSGSAAGSGTGGTDAGGDRGPRGSGGESTVSGGTGGGIGGVRNDLLLRQIREAITRNIAYPERARRMGWEGQVVVSFTLLEDGSIRDISIRKSSGVSVLDEATEDALRKSTVRVAQAGRLSVVLPIEFRLK
jgi:protein TonB